MLCVNNIYTKVEKCMLRQVISIIRKPFILNRRTMRRLSCPIYTPDLFFRGA
jgi:hypothetical protein